jgi:hypothetical protein
MDPKVVPAAVAEIYVPVLTIVGTALFVVANLAPHCKKPDDVAAKIPSCPTS